MEYTEDTSYNNTNLDHLFEAFFNSSISEKKLLSPHGSNREIIRLYGNDGHTAIGIYNKNIFENKAFIEFTNHFYSFKLNVPKIYSTSIDLTTYIIEDLGDTTLFNLILKKDHDFDNELESYYVRAIQELLKFQIKAGKSIDYNYCYQFRTFGKENIDYDINYFKERFLYEFHHNDEFDKKLDAELEYLKYILVRHKPEYFLYRDFQSRNIMLYHDDLYFIDYQSGRKGPLQYDIASLLFDAKANLPNDFREKLLKVYTDSAAEYVKINTDEFIESFWYFALIRILQAFGAYGFLSKIKGKTQFLESIPFAQRNFDYIYKNKINNNKFNYLHELICEIEHGTA